MTRNPYDFFRGRELTLNDHLAIDRTVLSNERTLLAYGRTALAMLIIGGSCIKFFDSVWMQALGVPFVAGGVVVMGWGWRRYERTRRFLAAALQHQTGSPEHPLKEKASRSSPAPADQATPARSEESSAH
ncbi:MAG: DUF202 domain-containing protein [Leptolyngbya sp. PLA2]|nr:DUF202 domain-containing protein [Leptolyngbya sp.]MCE7971846.1 DUF202 domain-containing protein [Leptolyngbya sp. PL-A2]MCZ7634487.1 DUF202 domain-containing protein [Phycisphaerales bacterium]MDL1904715.1 DUF202 domain-containing protein [Synechococcales cyanobacterium CNB]GIK19803.1 MAG: hypothetical protein BroJett004_19670 [Planctomycetota bacterium]